VAGSVGIWDINIWDDDSRSTGRAQSIFRKDSLATHHLLSAWRSAGYSWFRKKRSRTIWVNNTSLRVGSIIRRSAMLWQR